MVTRDKSGAVEQGTYRVITLLDAVTATTTSAALNIAGAKKITLAFTRANHAAGSTAFSVTVSADTVNFFPFNKLITNTTNAITEGLVRVSSVSLSSNTTSFVSMDLQHDVYLEMKATATETTDGTHTVIAIIEY